MRPLAGNLHLYSLGLGMQLDTRSAPPLAVPGRRVRLMCWTDPTKNIQVWWATIREGLFSSASRRPVRQRVWKGKRKSNHARDGRKVGTSPIVLTQQCCAKVLRSLIGIGEIVLLPLDVLKIKRQTNPEAFRGRGVFRIVADEGMGLYRGAGWTAARNAPGSFAVSRSCHNQSTPVRSESN